MVAIALLKRASVGDILLVIAHIARISCDGSFQRGSLYVSIKCPASGEAACAMDTPPAELYNGLSLAQCSMACNRVEGCKYFNHFELDKSGVCSSGKCRLFTSQPLNLGNIATCKLYEVRRKLNSQQIEI